MTIGSVLLGLALLVLVAMYVARPLLVGRGLRRPRNRSRANDRQSLLAQKEALLAQIHELDFDFETGKVPEADYRQEREALMSQATAVLKEIDRLDGEIEASVTAGREEVDAGRRSDRDAEIEAAVARLRESTPDASPEIAAKEPAHAGNGRARYCSQCGQPTDPDDKFCAHCGHRLHEPQAA
jgi:NADH pyrophosphatase NudC (nudix superfamily)